MPVAHLPQPQPHSAHRHEQDKRGGGGHGKIGCFLADRAFLLLEGARLARIADGEAEVGQRMLDPRFVGLLPIEADQHLFMGE